MAHNSILLPPDLFHTQFLSKQIIFRERVNMDANQIAELTCPLMYFNKKEVCQNWFKWKDWNSFQASVLLDVLLNYFGYLCAEWITWLVSQQKRFSYHLTLMKIFQFAQTYDIDWQICFCFSRWVGQSTSGISATYIVIFKTNIIFNII